jgi:cell wall-associated NlpC family hydrolase
MARNALLALVALAAVGCGGATQRSADRSSATVPRAAVKVTTDRVAPATTRTAKRHAAKPNIPTVPAPRSRALRPKRPAPTSAIAPGAPSDAEVARELAKAMGYKPGTASVQTVRDRGILQPDGRVKAPPSAPYAVQAMVAAGNEVAHLPYVYGGGHGTWVDSAYDCSGSVSFALANAGFLTTQDDSGQLARFGAPGRGRWVTIYANAGHAYMVVAGIRFDTSGRNGPRGSRWQAAMRSGAGFTVRHPPGL